MERYFDYMYSKPKSNWWMNTDSLKNVVTFLPLIVIQDGFLTTDTLGFGPIAVADTSDVSRATNDAVLIRNLAISCTSCIRITENIILRVFIGSKFSYVQAGLISASIFSIAFDKAKPVRNGLNFFRIMFYGLISERYFTLLNINSNFGYSQWLNEYDICELYKIISRRLILFVRWIQNMLGSITRWVHCLFWVYRVNNLFKVLWCNGYHFGLWIQQSEFESR